MEGTKLFPNYVAAFSCIGGACEDSCCSGGWNVSIDEATYESYKQLSNEKFNLLDSIHVDEKSKRFKMLGGDCSFLDENKYCKIHSAFGEESLCNTCRVYPRYYKGVDEQLETSLTPSCPEAARLILLKKEGIDFTIDYYNENELKFERADYTTESIEKYFWPIRQFCISILQNRTQSLEVRLIILGLFIEKVSRLTKEELEQNVERLVLMYEEAIADDNLVASLKDIDVPIHFQLTILKTLLNNLSVKIQISSRYKDVFMPTYEAVSQYINGDETLYMSYKNKYQGYMHEYEYVLENYLVNTMFTSMFPFENNDWYENYIQLVTKYLLVRVHLLGAIGKAEEVDEALFVKVIQPYAKAVEHDSGYLKNVSKALREKNYHNMAHLMSLIRLG